MNFDFKFLTNLKLAHKITFMCMLSVISCGVILGYATINQAKNQSLERTEKNIKELVQAKKDHVNKYLRSIEEDLEILRINETALKGVQEFSEAYAAFGDQAKDALQKAYIKDNPNPTGQKEKLDRAPEENTYNTIHGIYHPELRTFLQKREYYDIFLIDMQGNVVFTVFKELDFATNVFKGQWKDSDLGKLGQELIKTGKEGDIIFKDFQLYAPSNNVPASFIGTPIYDRNHQKVGALVFQMPVERFSNLIENAIGLGKTGDTYLVGSDHLMQSDSRFTPKGKTDILTTKVTSEGVDRALAGKSGFIETTVKGVDVMMYYTPLSYRGAKWAMITTESMDEVMEYANAQQNILIMLTLAVVIAIAALGYAGVKYLLTPLTKLIKVMMDLSQGDRSKDIPYKNRKDEIGAVASALQIFKNNQDKVEELNHQSIQEAIDAQKRIKNEMLGLSDLLEKEIKDIVTNVQQKVSSMMKSASGMIDSVRIVSEDVTIVAASSEETSINVQSVAGSAEKLAQSVQDVTAKVAQAAQISQDAVMSANQTGQIVSNLAESASKISEIIEIISNIAEQTNLLALNATIESARAGEAGKGFAVVAAEVKNLASQTTKATEEITQQIQGIQEVTNQAVKAIENISITVKQVDDISSDISREIDDQENATNGISESTQQAAIGSREVSSSIAKVGNQASQTRELAQEVSTIINDVGQLVQFLQDRLQVVVRTSIAGNRRTHERVEDPGILAVLHVGGQHLSRQVINLSSSGVAVDPNEVTLHAGDQVSFSLQNIDGQFNGKVVSIDDKQLRILFPESDAVETFIASFAGKSKKAA